MRAIMKRDMDLARRILQDVEACADRDGLRVINYPDVDQGIVDYHLIYCLHAGLVQGVEHNNNCQHTLYAVNLTPSGHDFVDKSRSNQMWTKAKDALVSKGLPIAIDTLMKSLGKLIDAAI